MFGHKDKRATPGDPAEAANAALRAEVERLEALPMTQLAAEVMARGFGPGGYLPSIVGRKQPALVAAYVSDIAAMFETEGARDADLYYRLCAMVGEGVQVLEHASLIWARRVRDSSGVGYAPTRRGQAALEAGAVEEAVRGRAPGLPE
jgi:hypothetical protein